MNQTAESVLTAAMSLPEREREALTLKLLEHMPAPEEWEEVSEDEIVAEVLRHHEQAVRDSTVCRSADEVHDRLQAEIDAAAPR
jgi:hypothetical protein